MSASWMTTTSPSTAGIPARIAAPLPRFAWRITLRAVALGDLDRSVGRAVIDDDHLRVELQRLDPLENLADGRRLVESGHDQRDAHWTILRRFDLLVRSCPKSS